MVNVLSLSLPSDTSKEVGDASFLADWVFNLGKKG